MTMNYYQNHAQTFFDGTVDLDMTPLYADFMAHLPERACVLDAGCGSGRDALAFAVQNAAHVGEQNQIRAKGRRQRRCCLIGVNIHQLAFIGHADGADDRQETALQQGVNQRRRARLR